MYRLKKRMSVSQTERQGEGLLYGDALERESAGWCGGSFQAAYSGNLLRAQV